MRKHGSSSPDAPSGIAAATPPLGPKQPLTGASSVRQNRSSTGPTERSHLVFSGGSRAVAGSALRVRLEVLLGQSWRGAGQPGVDDRLSKGCLADRLQLDENGGVAVEMRDREESPWLR